MSALTPRQRLILSEAHSWITTPYHHRASCKGAGCDCLGLIRGIWRALYAAEPCDLPYYAMGWDDAEARDGAFGGAEALLSAAGQYLRAKPLDQAACGDVLLFRILERGAAKHLGIQSAVGPHARFIHAYSGHAVTESPLSAPWQRRIVARFTFPPRRRRAP